MQAKISSGLTHVYRGYLSKIPSRSRKIYRASKFVGFYP